MASTRRNAAAIALAFVLAAPPFAGAAEDAREVKASALIGKAVKNPKGEALGRMRDLVVDLDDNRVRYAIIEAQDRLYRYSLAQFDPSSDGTHVVLYVPRARLERSPGMDPDWEGFGLARASELLGGKLVGRDGRRLGELTDMMVDWRDGSVPFAMADLAGDAGPGTRVRLDALRMRGDELVLER